MASRKRKNMGGPALRTLSLRPQDLSRVSSLSLRKRRKTIRPMIIMIRPQTAHLVLQAARGAPCHALPQRSHRTRSQKRRPITVLVRLGQALVDTRVRSKLILVSKSVAHQVLRARARAQDQDRVQILSITLR